MSDTRGDSHQERPRAGWSYSGEVWTDRAGRAVVPSGGQGAAVALTGGGFTSGEKVVFDYKTGLTSPTKVVLCKATADTNGVAGCSGTIPTGADAGSTGVHKILAKGLTSLTKATATFTLL